MHWIWLLFIRWNDHNKSCLATAQPITQCTKNGLALESNIKWSERERHIPSQSYSQLFQNSLQWQHQWKGQVGVRWNKGYSPPVKMPAKLVTLGMVIKSTTGSKKLVQVFSWFGSCLNYFALEEPAWNCNSNSPPCAEASMTRRHILPMDLPWIILMNLCKHC